MVSDSCVCSRSVRTQRTGFANKCKSDFAPTPEKQGRDTLLSSYPGPGQMTTIYQARFPIQEVLEPHSAGFTVHPSHREEPES